jgi:hypothetical protein
MKKEKKGKGVQQFEGPIRLSLPFVTMQTLAGTVGGDPLRFGITGTCFLIVSITAQKNPNSGDAAITFSVIIDSNPSPATQYTATVQCPQGLSVAVPAIFAIPAISVGYHLLQVAEPTGTCSGTFTVAILQFGGQ